MKSIDLASIDLNLLVAFEALFEERSVTAAAKRLYLGQPAMSAALGRLRILFNDELFIRIGREMQPTSKAVAIAPDIFAALRQIRHTIEFSQSFNPISAQRNFAIGSADYTSFVILPKLLEYCREKAPSLNFRMIGFDKDNVGEMLEHGTIELALGVFPNSPRQTICVPLFQERFIGIARKKHPAIKNKPISLETFANLSHVLVTLRQDATGEIDKILATHNLQRRIQLTTPHLLILPAIISSSDMIAAVPYRIGAHFSKLANIEVFELPLETQPWTVSLMWSQLTDKDDANTWLRQTLRTVCEQI
ncbi:MAG: LysR family transcriptional regulator [Calothrix sp. FI2-JRJ7]|jgi:DNA-binding transcriptional LysR family regulator|nr:LysR family transcriptional regulator [Calothrix sp. FI2-JRJ7]